MEDSTQAVQNTTPEKGYLKAIGFALLLGLIGVFAWAIIGGLFDILSSYIAFGIAAGIRYGYDKAHGPKKGRIAIFLIMYIVLIFLSVQLTFYFAFLTLGYQVNFFSIILIMFDRDFVSEMWMSYLLAALFAGLGSVALFNNRLFSKYQQGEKGGAKGGVKGGTKGLGERFSVLVPFEGDFEGLKVRVNEFLESKNFTLYNYGEEEVYRKGDGYTELSKVIKYEKDIYGVRVQAFVIINQKEQGLEGFAGIIHKKPLKEVVDELLSLIREY